MIVRASTTEDATALAEIYGHHVLNGFGTFEEVPPSVQEMAARRQAVVERGLPHLVAEQAGEVLGFAYAAPVQGTVTDGFGWRENAFHYGTDIAADAGTVISSFADGTVTAVGDSSQLGNYVTVSHAGAFTTLYAHCSRITASSGQQVALGDPIAEVGETGNATGPHLHFAIQKDTVYLDPAYYGIG